MQKNIFHIHTYICKHASNTIDEIVHYALKHGYKKLYITEHPPITVACPYQVRRANYADIKKIVNDIKRVNKLYKNKLHIYFGYEIEFNEANRYYYEKMLRDPYCEFVIFGNHFYGDIFKIQQPLPLVVNVTKTDKQLQEFSANNIAALSSNLFSGIAHPEIFLNSYQKGNKQAKAVCQQIINLAIKNKLTLAFNVNFKSWQDKSEWHYPSIYFGKMVAKTNIPVIIESDAHDMHSLTVEGLAKSKDLALDFGLKKNLKNDIKLKLLPKKPQLVLCEQKLYESIPSSLLKSFANNNVTITTIDDKTNINSLIKKYRTNPAGTIVITESPSILKQLIKSACFVISNKNCDIKISQLKNINWNKLLKIFVKEVYLSL